MLSGIYLNCGILLKCNPFNKASSNSYLLVAFVYCYSTWPYPLPRPCLVSTSHAAVLITTRANNKSLYTAYLFITLTIITLNIHIITITITLRSFFTITKIQSLCLCLHLFSTFQVDFPAADVKNLLLNGSQYRWP